MKGNKEKKEKKEMLKEKKQGLSVEGNEKRRADSEVEETINEK